MKNKRVQDVTKIRIIIIRSSELKPSIKGKPRPPIMPKDKVELKQKARCSVGKSSRVVRVKIILKIYNAALDAIDTV